MLIALLAVLGVDLIVIVMFAALVFGRRRWLKRQPGVFAGAIRVASGDIDGLSPNWKRGSGRWVRDVLVWNKAPLMFTNELIAVDQISGEHQAKEGEVKRIGDTPIIIEFAADRANIEVAGRPEHRALMTGRFGDPTNPASAATANP